MYHKTILPLYLCILPFKQSNRYCDFQNISFSRSLQKFIPHQKKPKPKNTQKPTKTKAKKKKELK